MQYKKRWSIVVLFGALLALGASTPSNLTEVLNAQHELTINRPGDAEVLNDLGNLLVLAGELEEAEDLDSHLRGGLDGHALGTAEAKIRSVDRDPRTPHQGVSIRRGIGEGCHRECEAGVVEGQRLRGVEGLAKVAGRRDAPERRDNPGHQPGGEEAARAGHRSLSSRRSCSSLSIRFGCSSLRCSRRTASW